jgi:hypothetical protein
VLIPGSYQTAGHGDEVVETGGDRIPAKRVMAQK